MPSKKLMKLALYGALAAVAIDYFVDPSLKKTVGLR